MKNAFQIIAAIDNLNFLEYRVEKLASDHSDLGYGRQQVPGNREAIETSSAGVFVNGIVVIDSSFEQINVPFVTGFLFTCIKGSDSIYKLRWSSSLS